MKEIEVCVRIEGVTPLFFNKRPPEEEGPKKAKAVEYNYEEDALKKAHGDKKDGFFIPSDMLQASMREAGKSFPLKKSTHKKLAAIAVKVSTEQVPLEHKGYVVDTRWGTHPSTGNSVAVSRVRFDKWAADFTLTVNIDRITVDMTKTILEEAGDVCGIGSYKPANKNPGPYGRFKVTKWEVNE